MEVDDADILDAIKHRLDLLVNYEVVRDVLDTNKQWPQSLEHDALKNTRRRLNEIIEMLAHCHLNKWVELHTGPINGALGCVEINILDRANFDKQCVILLTKKEKLFRYNPHMGSAPIFQMFTEAGYKPVRDGKTLDHNRYKFWIAQNQLDLKACRKVRKLKHAAGDARK